MCDELPGLENEGIALDGGFQNFISSGATFQMKPYWSEREQFMFIELLCSSCSLTLQSMNARCSGPHCGQLTGEAWESRESDLSNMSEVAKSRLSWLVGGKEGSRVAPVGLLLLPRHLWKDLCRVRVSPRASSNPGDE